jgi:hypothetical protein
VAVRADPVGAPGQITDGERRAYVAYWKRRGALLDERGNVTAEWHRRVGVRELEA